MLTPQEITHSLFCRGGGGCGRGEGTLASPAAGIAQPIVGDASVPSPTSIAECICQNILQIHQRPCQRDHCHKHPVEVEQAIAI